jgi:uncharacterized protein YggE
VRNFYEQFKTPIVTILIFFVALFLYTTFAGPIPFTVNSINTNKTDFFTAEGSGEESAVPDTATVYLGITAQGTSVTDAQNKANSMSDKIIKSVKDQGIAEKDIKTTNYSINPNYGTGGAEPLIYPGTGNQRIVGYTVNQSFEVKVKPIDKVNKVIDSATQAGANQVQGASFTFSDDLLKTLEDKARKEAVSKAKQKAQSLANSAGVRLGRVVNVVESSSTPGIYPLRATAQKVEDSMNETNITPGENTVSINVTIFYETR